VGDLALLRPQGPVPLQVMPLHSSDLKKRALSQGLAEVSKGPRGACCSRKF